MRLFAFFGSLLVIALLAALVVPPYVDWNQFKNRFESEASRVLGLPVEVLGQTSARLLPLPSVTFTDLRIRGGSESEPMLAAESFKLDIELAPLLKGDVVIVDMQLVAPKLNFKIDPSGKLQLPKRNEPDNRLGSSEITFENIVITNGEIQLKDQNNTQVLMVSDIVANVAANELVGPWRGQGTALVNDERVRISGSTGRWQEEQRVSLKLDIEPQSLPYDFRFDGPMSFADSLASLKGQLRVRRMANQNSQDLIIFRRPDPDTALPIRLESDVEISSGGAIVPAFKLDIGSFDDPYTVTGNGQAVFGNNVSFRVRAEGQQINVERFSKEGGNSGSKARGQSLQQRLESLRLLLDRIPRFELDGEINLYLPAVVAGDTVIREVGLDLRPLRNAEGKVGDGWQIGNLEAQLPGRTELRADGKLTTGENLNYDGDLLIASRQPSGLAKWLGSERNTAVRDISNAGFSAKVSISEDEAQFENVELILDGQSLKGSIRRVAKPEQPPLIEAILSGQKIDVDQLNGVIGMFYGGDGKSFVNDHHMNLDLKAGQVTFLGATAQEVTTRFSLSNDAINIQNLDVQNLNGSAFNVTGQLTKFRTKPNGSLAASFTASDPADFLALINEQFGPFPLVKSIISSSEIVADTDLKVDVQAADGDYSIKMNGSLAGSELVSELSSDDFSKSLSKQRLRGKLVLVNDNAGILLNQIGLQTVPLDDVGRGALRLSTSGSAHDGLDTEAALTLKAGYISAAGRITPSVVGENLAFEGMLKLEAEVQDADRFILLSGLPVPGFGKGLDGRLKGALELSGDRLVLTDLNGVIGDANYNGTVALDRSVRPRPRLTGNLGLSSVDATMFTGMVFTGSGSAAKPILSEYDGKLQLNVNEVTLENGLPSLDEFSSDLVIRDGDIALQDIKGSWLDGAVTGNIALARSTSSNILNGQLSVDNGSAELMLEALKLNQVLTGRASVKGTFETTGIDRDAMVSSLTASGLVTLQSAAIREFNSEAFKLILRKADQLKDEEVVSKAGSLLDTELKAGAFKFDSVDIPFTIAAGTLRSNNVQLVNSDFSLKSSGRLELVTGDVELEGRGAFNATKEAVVGASPEFSYSIVSKNGKTKRSIDAGLFETYLGLRVSERRQREFESQRSAILERQRLQQTVRLYGLKEDAKRIAAQERERILKLEAEQEERRKREEARRRREELERKRLDAELKAAEKQAAREAALEAGRRAKRQEQIDVLRKRAEEALQRFRLDEEIRVEEPSVGN